MPQFDPKKYAATPLMIAAANGEMRVLLQLLAASADVNARDNRGGTALMYAVMNQHADIVQLLVDVGADPRLKTNSGMSAFSIAESQGLESILRALREAAARLNAAENVKSPTEARIVQTHYDNLKVSRNAPPEIIKAAYRTLSQKYHPDRNASRDAERIMTILNAAYETLSDPAKRKAHDEWIANEERELANKSVRPETRGGPFEVNETPKKESDKSASYAAGRAVAHVARHWILYGLAALVGFVWLNDEPKKQPSSASSAPAVEKQTRNLAPTTLNTAPTPAPRTPTLNNVDASRAESDLKPIQVKQGVLRRFTSEERIAPFRIVTPPGSENYYVKLVDSTTGAPALSLFVYGGSQFETKAPLGSFRVKYATGQTWYGEKHLFGKDTQYSMADQSFEFSVDGDRINGYTVELIKQRGGNLHTRSISQDQF